MKRNTVAGVIAAVTIAVGTGAGVAGYTIARNNHKTAQAAQAVQDNTAEKTAAAEKAAAEQKAEAMKAELAAQKKAAAQAEKDRQAAENKVLAIKLGQRMKANAQQRAAEKAAAEKAAAEKAAAEKAAAEKAEAEKKAAEEEAKKVVTIVVGHDNCPEVVESGMMCGDCVDRITDLYGGASGGCEETLTADEPVLFMLNDDGSFEATEKYGTIETGKEYFTKITVHTDGRAFASDLRVCENLQGWRVASVEGSTATLFSPVFIAE